MLCCVAVAVRLLLAGQREGVLCGAGDVRRGQDGADAWLLAQQAVGAGGQDEEEQRVHVLPPGVQHQQASITTNHQQGDHSILCYHANHTHLSLASIIHDQPAII